MKQLCLSPSSHKTVTHKICVNPWNLTVPMLTSYSIVFLSFFIQTKQSSVQLINFMGRRKTRTFFLLDTSLEFSRLSLHLNDCWELHTWAEAWTPTRRRFEDYVIDALFLFLNLIWNCNTCKHHSAPVWQWRFKPSDLIWGAADSLSAFLCLYKWTHTVTRAFRNAPVNTAHIDCQSFFYQQCKGIDF